MTTYRSEDRYQIAKRLREGKPPPTPVFQDEKDREAKDAITISTIYRRAA